jgi:hypothetical protein
MTGRRMLKLATTILGVGLASSSLFAKADGLKVNGHLDMNYSYNMNTPGGSGSAEERTDNVGLTGADRANSFNLQHVQLDLHHNMDPVSLNVKLGYGPLMEDYLGKEDGVSEGIQEAYVTYKCPVTGLVVDFGKFATHLGYEYDLASSNWNYSRSIMYLTLPSWNTGVKFTYPWEKMSLSFLLNNGVDQGLDGGKSKNVGAQFMVKPMDNFDITFNYEQGISGNTNNSNTEDAVMFYDLVAHYSVSDDLGFGFYYGMQNFERKINIVGEKKEQELSSVALYARYNFMENWSVAPRLEMFNDEDGRREDFSGKATTPITTDKYAKNDITALTLTVENKLTENLKLRLEYRNDMSDEKIYLEEKGTAKEKATDGQSVVLVGLMGDF